MDRFLTFQQAAERLGVSHMTVRRRAAEQHWTLHNVGTQLRPKLRVAVADFERYVASWAIQL